MFPVSFPKRFISKRYFRLSAFLIHLLTAILLFSPGAFSEAASPTPPETLFFQAIPANADANIEDWARLGVPTKTAEALVAFQKNPSLRTAVGVHKHYNVFAHNDDMRRACFANHKQIFQSLDAAKYDLIIMTQRQLPDLDHSFRVGSTGARFKAWIDWVKTGCNLDDMPRLDANKQFKSDDDITNVASRAARKKNPLASELINGETARKKFKEITRALGTEIDPKLDMQVEFLSPTSAAKILCARRPGEFSAADWPAFIQAWYSSDPEKYTGQYGEEQLHQWGMQAGFVTENVDDPIASSKTYAEFHSADPDRGFPKFPPEDIFGWVAGNHRQIFSVHGGDLKSMAKYMLREVSAWKKLGFEIPPLEIPGKGSMTVDDLETMADMIYKPETEAQIQHVKNIAPTAGKILKTYLHQLLVAAHKKNVRMLVERLQTIPLPRPGEPEGAVDDAAYRKAAEADEEVQKLMNNIAVGYTNLDDETIRQIELELNKDIELGFPKDLEEDISFKKASQGRLARHLKGLMEEMKGAAQTTRRDIEAFRFLRYTVGEELNTHLTNVAGKNLDHYLVKAVQGDVTESQLRWQGGRPQTVQRVLDPVEIADDIRFMRSMARDLKYGDEKLATMVDDYFKGNPPAALEMLKRLHEIYDPDKMRPLVFKYKDADGNEVVRQIQPSRWDSTRSLGLVMFKGALKGWKIWGDLASGRDLYNSMYKIYGDKSSSAADIAAAQCKALSSFIGIVEYVELVNLYGSSTITANIPLGGTLGQAALLADGGYFEPQAQKDLALSLIKDISCLYIPQLAVANAVWGMASWGYDKYMLSGAKAEFIDLLVKNGDWQIPKTLITDENGNQREVADRTKLPELLAVQYSADGKTVSDRLPTNKIKKGNKEVTTCWRLAKLPDPKGKYARGVVLLKSSGVIVKPREALMEVAYRSSQGFNIATNQLLSITEKAIRELIDDKWFNFKLYWTSTRSWTAEWLKTDMGVIVPTPEDARILVKKKVEPVKPVESWLTGTFNWKEWVADGIRKNFGYLVSDYWVRRQKILEDDIIPLLIEEASRQVMKDDMDKVASNYLDEIKQMDKRLMELDDRVWKQIARSAAPFKVTRDRNPKTDIPITKWFQRLTKSQRAEIMQMVKWLDNPDPARTPYVYMKPGMTRQGNEIKISTKLDEDGVKNKAKEFLNQMIDLMYKLEKAYDKMLKDMSGMNGYVAQSHGRPGLSLDPHHIPLRPVKGNDANQKLVDKWASGYRGEYTRLEQDVGNILNVRGWGKISSFERKQMSPLENTMANLEEGEIPVVGGTIGDWGGTGFEFYAAKSHPYWKKLLRLRFQIHKLQLTQKNIQEVTKKEVLTIFKDGRMLLEDKSINPNNPPTSLTPVEKNPNSANGVSLPAAGSTTTASTPSSTSNKTSISLGIATPKERQAFIKKMIELMEEEYQRLLSRILNMFEMEIELKPVSPATELAVLTVMEASIKHQAKPGQIEEEKIKDVVKKYKWEILRRDQSRYIERQSKEPTIKLPLLEGGEVTAQDPTGGGTITKGKSLLLVVQALGELDIPLAQATQAFPVKPAKFSGRLKIWGDWPAHPPNDIPPVMIFADGWMVDTVEPPWGTDVDVPLNFKVTKVVHKPTQMNLKDLENKFYVDFAARAEVGVPPRARSEFVTGEIFPAELWLPTDDEHRLELFYPYRVTIEVETTDASGDKVLENIEITATGPKNSVNQPPYILPLNKGDLVSVKVKRLKKPLCEKQSKSKKFDPAAGKTLDFKVRLPFYKTDNLTVKGRFVAKADLDPPLKIEGGLVTSNLGYETSVSQDGSFSFKNRIAWHQLDTFEIKALIWEGDKGRVFRPVGGLAKDGFAKPILAQEFDMGNIELERHEVKVDPIPVKVTDWRGRILPEDKLKVLIGDRPATWDGNHFTGSWTFTKRRETVEIKASLTMDYGLPVEGQTEYTISDKDFLAGKVKISSPLTIKLEVYYPFSVFLKNKIKAPDDPPKPGRVKLTSAEIEGFNPPLNKYEVVADSEEPVLINAPVRLDQRLTIHAQAPPDQPQYRGSGFVVIPRKTGRAAMEITLTDKKKSPAISIQQLAVAGIGKDKQPKMGKGMVGSATIAVGEIESPQLSLNWMRKSDRAGEGELEVISVKNDTSYPVSKAFGSVPKNLQSKHDTLYLTVSDGGTPPQGDKAELDFEWQEAGDEFVKIKTPLRAKKGDQVEITSVWTIAEEMGTVREIAYSANGAEFFRSPVDVPEGKRFTHPVVLDTTPVKAGNPTITAALINLDPPLTASGSKRFKLEEDKDQIVRTAALTANNQSEAIEPDSGVNIWAQVRAGQERDGLRTLTARFRGQTPSSAFELKGGEKIDQPLSIDTSGLRPSSYSVRLKLFGPEGELEDTEVVRFIIQKKKDPDDSGLEDVYCSSSTINIKFWDHGAQDNDKVRIRIGKDWDKTVNLNACGGPDEPAGGGCVQYNLPLGKGGIATIRVEALNVGDIPPNTASLKIEGGCTPTLQHWNMQTGGIGKVTIRRGKPKKKR